ncbi:extracellular solute-binding protein [Antribacter gilvus]|uniref:extracellular solute-binding protein n=1 Tax=Antribacter gilvus TaxID=2304675 RepID=UPI001980B7BC|nr:extracellular solute-binding protein [Antribacter gilvus]
MTTKSSARTGRALAAAAAAGAVLLTAACGPDEPEAASLTTLTVMAPLLETQAPDPEGELQTAVEELIGKDLDITWVPNAEYGDKTTVTLASDQLPHVMVVQGKTPAFVQSAEAGAFWDLTDKLGDYPNLTANPAADQRSGVPIDTETIQLNASVNGTVYGVFRLRDAMRTAVVLRKDWLDALGLDAPTTTDELYEVAKAFSEQDPDGNGQDDTYGIVVPKWPGSYGTSAPYDVIETWFGAPNAWGEVDGELVPGFATEEFFEANAYVKKMVDEGIVNPDYATLDSGTWNDPFVQGKGGIIIDVSSRAGVLMGLFKEQDPEGYGDYVTMEGNLVGPDGDRHSYPTPGFNGFLAIPKSSVPTEEMLAEVLTVLDTMSSEEGQILLNNGIEGRNFEVVDGFARGLDEEDPEIELLNADIRAFAQLGTNTNGYQAYTALPAGDPELELWNHRQEIHTRDSETVVANPTLPLVSPTQVERGATLDQIVADARIKYYAGQLDEAGFRAEVQRWFDEGGDEIVTEMNELYAGLG